MLWKDPNLKENTIKGQKTLCNQHWTAEIWKNTKKTRFFLNFRYFWGPKLRKRLFLVVWALRKLLFYIVEAYDLFQKWGQKFHKLSICHVANEKL